MSDIVPVSPVDITGGMMLGTVTFLLLGNAAVDRATLFILFYLFFI